MRSPYPTRSLGVIATFLSLIDELDVCPPVERADIQRRICETFEAERAVLALDMSGYAFSVRRGGVLPHLCKIRRMQMLSTPLVENFQGEVIRQIADNILAVFETPAQAIGAAIAINHEIRDSQREHAEEDCHLSVAIGIDYGRLLLVSGYDCFGDPVNIAYKLGEDVARAGEILITDNARQRLDPPGAFALEELRLSLSGLEVFAHKLLYDEHG